MEHGERYSTKDTTVMAAWPIARNGLPFPIPGGTGSPTRRLLRPPEMHSDASNGRGAKAILPLNREKLEISVACDAFLAAREGAIAPATLKTYRAAFALLVNSISGMLVTGIGPRDIESWQSALIRAGYERTTVRSYLKAVSALFAWLETSELITSNPVKRVRLVRQTEKTRQILTWEHASALIDVVDSPEYRLGVGLAIYAGLRRSEVIALRWDNIDENAGIIRVANTATWTTKSGRARETVILPALQPLIEGCPRPGSYVVMDPRHGETRTAREQGLVRAFERARATAGLPKSLRFHDLRGSFATELLQRFPPAVVQQILGHADVQTTMRFYSRIDPQRAVEIVKTRLRERPVDLT